MTKIKAFVDRHQVLIPFLIIAVISILGFARIEASSHEIKVAAQERKYQICKAEIEDRILIEDILNFVASNTSGSSELDIESLPPELQELIQQSQANSAAFNEFANERLDIPPDICNGTGITEEQIREELDAEGIPNG